MSLNRSLSWQYLKRLGIALLLVLWFAFLSLPCALFALARDGQIVFSRSRIPGDVLLRIQLLSDADYTGLSITTSQVSRNEDASRACVWSRIRYLFWRGAAVEPAQFCECYRKDEGLDIWLSADEQAPTACRFAS